MTDKIVVLSTCGSAEEAGKLARTLVEQRLAACVTVLPGVCSFYRWNGAIEENPEHMLLIKTSRALFDRLRTEIEKAHSYEVPELLALPIVAGSPNYLNWLMAELPDSEDVRQV